ncbi:cytochrome P450 [Gymnopilus junonius]|uniref:Cytochrome P450 n=1 Tax=Gymnopilus junonius TaxID=109634 RepID=A0A9P5TQM9_GYMJU|nr:cytochrome P450 [Gymnopilus junonius]
MTPLFYDTAYRLKSEWDKLLDSSAAGVQVEIEMHEWTMKLTLDTVGRAIFGHDFHTLEGNNFTIEEALRIFNTTTPSKLGMLAYVASIFVPWVGNLPTKRNRLFKNLSDSARLILDGMLHEKEREKDNSVRVEKGQKSEKSLIEFLIDAETNSSGLLSAERKEEIVTQMKAILIAGSDPPGLIIVWSLIELARHPEIQARIRAEINSSHGVELDWNRLQSSCPFLDAFISEVLRLRPSVGETPRVTNEDDILLLKEPIKDASGRLTEKIYLPKGTKVIVPNHFLNVDPEIWGPDAAVFNPDRWLNDPLMKLEKSVDDSSASAKGRLWTFGEGPRVCVGKAFAMTQLKIVLAILLHEFSFDLPEGRETLIDLHYSLVARPKVRGRAGANIPLLVSRAR